MSGEIATGTAFRIYRRPEGQEHALAKRPLLASWNAGTDPAQVALAEYRAGLQALVAPELAAVTGPAALLLRVGLAGPPGAEAEGDLDNFLTPVMDALGAGRFAAVFGEKHQGGSSLIIGPAVLAPLDEAGWSTARVRTAVSYTLTGYKEQIAGAVGKHDIANTGAPVELQVSFTTGPGRTWPLLWKPTIDALGGVLGEPGKPWHPHDHRIVRLGLHHTVDQALGWDIDIALAWREAPS